MEYWGSAGPASVGSPISAPCSCFGLSLRQRVVGECSSRRPMGLKLLWFRWPTFSNIDLADAQRSSMAWWLAPSVLGVRLPPIVLTTACFHGSASGFFCPRLFDTKVFLFSLIFAPSGVVMLLLCIRLSGVK